MARLAVTSGYYGDGTNDHYGPDSNARYTPALYAKKTLRRFLAGTVFQDICNRDYEGELKSYGSKLYLRKDPDITVNPYSIGGTLTYQVPKEDAVVMEINKARYTAFRVDDVDKAQSDLDLINMFSKNTEKEIKIEVDSEVLEYMATAAHASNAGATAGVISGNLNLGAAGAPISITSVSAIQKILDLAQALEEQNVDGEPWMVIPAWYANKLLGSDKIQASDFTGDAAGSIRTGYLGTVLGVKLYRNNNLYSVTDATTTRAAYYILYGTKEACTFAAQVDKADSIPIPDSFGQYWRSLFVWGRLVAQPAALAVLYCEPSAA